MTNSGKMQGIGKLSLSLSKDSRKNHTDIGHIVFEEKVTLIYIETKDVSFFSGNINVYKTS